MEFRRTDISDIDDIMVIIKQAQAYLKSKGINQWQNNYPNPETFKSDIDSGYSYVLVKEGRVIATAAISFDGEETYNEIHEGEWLSDYDYAVIHRVAVDSLLKGMGLSQEVIRQTEVQCRQRKIRSIKVDTHEQNESMQRLLLKCGFSYCGVIYLNDGSKRLAYEKLV